MLPDLDVTVLGSGFGSRGLSVARSRCNLWAGGIYSISLLNIELVPHRIFIYSKITFLIWIIIISNILIKASASSLYIFSSSLRLKHSHGYKHCISLIPSDPCLIYNHYILINFFIYSFVIFTILYHLNK